MYLWAVYSAFTNIKINPNITHWNFNVKSHTWQMLFNSYVQKKKKIFSHFKKNWIFNFLSVTKINHTTFALKLFSGKIVSKATYSSTNVIFLPTHRAFWQHKICLLLVFPRRRLQLKPLTGDISSCHYYFFSFKFFTALKNRKKINECHFSHVCGVFFFAL